VRNVLLINFDERACFARLPGCEKDNHVKQLFRHSMVAHAACKHSLS
jgi:hypothetical protein